ncbi:MAG: flavodoxin [Bacillota bacterium]|nr:flavodoxin [Bacillota bacterium]
MKAIVVYYSFSGLTRKMAEEIARMTGAEIRELVPEKRYSFDEHAALRELKNEVEDRLCPALAEGLDPVGDADIVFVGSPNWIQTFAPPVRTFLRHCDLRGKILIPFCTHGGGGIGRVVEDMRAECPDSVVREGLALKTGERPDSLELIAPFLKSVLQAE